MFILFTYQIVPEHEAQWNDCAVARSTRNGCGYGSSHGSGRGSGPAYLPHHDTILQGT